MKKTKKYEYLIMFLFFIILTIPRTVNEFFPHINVIKILVVAIIFLMFGLNVILKKKRKLSKLTRNMILFSTYLFLITLINKVSPITFFKVYSMNIAILLLCEFLFSSKYKEKFISNFSNYFLILIILNLIGIIYGYAVGHPNGLLFFNKNVYLLGQDNRFILYIIPSLLGFYYLSNIDNKNKNSKLKMYLTYLISIITLLTIWSVSAMVVTLVLGFAYLFFNKTKKFKLNIYIITIIIFLISIAIVFFKAHHIFEHFIVNVLHKSLDLSYRGIIWDDAINLLKNSVENIIFGFGYFDTSNSFINMPMPVNHLHNIIMNNIFFAGIIGSIIYYYSFYLIAKNVRSLKNTKNSNIITLIFISLLILMIFDTFELYQIYYFILYLIYDSKNILENKIVEEAKNEKETIS